MCLCEMGAWSHCLGWFTLKWWPGSPKLRPGWASRVSSCLKAPLSGLSAAGVSSPRKGLVLSSPPSEASTPADPGDRAQVGSFWGLGK